MKKKHVPFRMCVVCREKRPKTALSRFVFTNRGFLYDPYQNLSGRGFYICNKQECKKKFLKEKFQQKLKQRLVSRG